MFVAGFLLGLVVGGLGVAMFGWGMALTFGRKKQW